MTFKINRRMFVAGSTLVFGASMVSTKALALTNLEEVEGALLNMFEETAGREIDDLSESDIEEAGDNISRIARRVAKNRDVSDHVVDEWEYGGDKDHLEDCPTCNKVALDITRGTRVNNNVPNLDVPRHFWINGVLYIRDDNGFLYPAHPQTGQAIGPAHGYLWYTGSSYAGVSFAGGAYRAQPA